MDKLGAITLITGLVFCALGVFAIWAFLPEVIAAVEGLVGIVILLAGLMLLIFGILVFRD
jgi:hypothetical protein